MSKKTAFWIFVFLLAGTGILLTITNWNKIKKYFTAKIKTKQEAVKYLMEVNPQRNIDILQSFDEGFLIAAANADKSDEATFLYNGKTYYTATLKAKTS